MTTTTENKLKVGQTIFVRPTNNAARYSTEIKESTISKIGKKYFELEDFYSMRFSIEKMKEDTGNLLADYTCYLTMQEIRDEIDAKSISEWLNPWFGYGKPRLSAEKLRRVKAIVEE